MSSFILIFILTFILCHNVDSESRSMSLNIQGDAQFGYYVTFGLGTPPQNLNFLIDTGSSNIAISVSNKKSSFFNYQLSKTFHTQNQSLSIKYTEGSWSGFLAHDIVNFNNTLTCPLESQFSCIVSSNKIFDEHSEWNGIFGLAYPSLSMPSKLIKPLFDTLVGSCNVSDIFSISLCGPFIHEKIQSTKQGKLLMGTVSEDLYTGDILYTPIIREWYYDVIVTGIKIGDVNLDIPCTDFNKEYSIIDTGTTLMAFTPEIFKLVLDQIQKQSKSVTKRFSSEFWLNQKSVCTDSEDIITLFPTLELSFYHNKNSSFSIVIPPDLYLLRSDVKNMFCFSFAICPSPKGTIIGATILKGFYVIFDRENKRIGFANSTCSADANLLAIVNQLKWFDDSLNCKLESTHGSSAFNLLMKATLSLAILCLILFLVISFPCVRRTLRRTNLWELVTFRKSKI